MITLISVRKENGHLATQKLCISHSQNQWGN